MRRCAEKGQEYFAFFAKKDCHESNLKSLGIFPACFSGAPKTRVAAIITIPQKENGRAKLCRSKSWPRGNLEAVLLGLKLRFRPINALDNGRGSDAAIGACVGGQRTWTGATRWWSGRLRLRQRKASPLARLLNASDYFISKLCNDRGSIPCGGDSNVPAPSTNKLHAPSTAAHRCNTADRPLRY